jgi:hypothetical protein
MTREEFAVIQRIIFVAKEIAHDPAIDLVDSERRIRLYYALEQCEKTLPTEADGHDLLNAASVWRNRAIKAETELAGLDMRSK